MEGAAEAGDKRFAYNKTASALLWIIACGAYGVLLLRGFHSTHQGYVGDDLQLYEGVRHLWSDGSFYASIVNAYPPATAWVYLPFALFSWRVAHILWFFFSTGICLPIFGIVLYRQFGRDLPSLGLPVWLAVIFLSAPPYVVAYFGQIIWPMALALALAWQWAYSSKPRVRWLSGLLYAVALTKPTISLPFLIYQYLRRPTRTAATYGVFLTLVFTLATAAWYHHPAQIVSEYRATIHALVVPGAVNDTGFRNPRRGFLFNVAVLFFDDIRWVDKGQGVETPAETNIERVMETGFALFSCGLLVMLARQANALQKADAATDSTKVADWRMADDQSFAMLTLIAMLIFYHAWTDFGMLCLPLIVVINSLADKNARDKVNLIAMTLSMSLTLYILARNHALFALQTQVARTLLFLLFFQMVYSIARSQKRLPAA